MNPEIHHLFELAGKPERKIIGLMSGTSLDGLDVALCKVSGAGFNTKIKVDHFHTISYSEDQKNKIRKVFANADALLPEVCILNKWLAVLHAEFINDSLKKWNVSKKDVDLIASHGQTIYHAPEQDYFGKKYNSTFQIGDGDHIAVLTGITTISDFRQKHIAAGGEGAPLALYADYILFNNPEKETILLNIGGIANLTWLPEKGRKIISTDTGPGNTLMDNWMMKHFNKPMDENAAKALSGNVNSELFDILYSHPFFKKKFPKSCGQEIFNIKYVEDAIKELNTIVSHEDVLATLTALTSKSIIDCISALTNESFRFFISGGGLHNPLLLQHLRQGLQSAEFLSMDLFHPDAKEAVLFAILANEMVAGDNKIWEYAGIEPAVRMGKISFGI